MSNYQEVNNYNHLKPQFPDIQTYQSIDDFLKDYFNFRKLEDSQFSYENWTVELGYKSRSFMKMICSKKRNVTEDLIKRLSKSLSFSIEQENHITVLAELAQTKNYILKSIYRDNLQKSLNLDKSRKKLDDSLFLSSLHIPIIQLLTSYDDFKATTTNISKILNINPDEINSSLEKLESLRLIRGQVDTLSKNETIWKSHTRAFRFKSEKNIQAFTKFYEMNLKETERQLLEISKPEDASRFRCIYFALPNSELANLSQEVEDFLKKLRNKYGTNELKDQKIIKLNLQYYKISY